MRAQPDRRRLVRTTLLGLVVAAALVLVWVTVNRPATDPQPLRLGSGLPGGVYHALGRTLEEVTVGSSTPVTARTTPASVANLQLLADGEIDAGFTLEDVAALAVAGRPPFTEPYPVAAVARLYDNHTHLVTRADLPYRVLGDLAGATVASGAADSGTQMLAERLLEQAGLTQTEETTVLPLGLQESADALRDRRVDAFFWSGGLPTEAIVDLAADTPLRLVDLAEWVEPMTSAHGDHFSEVPIPAGTYPGVPGVRTIGVPSLLVVRADLPEEVAEALTEALFGARALIVEQVPAALQLTERSAIATLPVPLHPGAAAYYERVKVGHARAPAG